jgi:pyridoxamine 5'-phosphate oxidase
MKLASIRSEYNGDSIESLPADPHIGAEIWLEHALKVEAEATAFSLATADSSGRLSVRVVLAKAIDASGVTFYTNGKSLKGLQLDSKPVAAGVFFWPKQHRQIRFEGRVTRVTEAEADDYFKSRPHASQVASAISNQSTELAHYNELQARFEKALADYAGLPVPRPPHWGGYTIALERVEFWQGQPSRLHQRILFEQQKDGSYKRTWLEP